MQCLTEEGIDEYNTLPLTAFKFVSTYHGHNGSLMGITESLGRMFC